MSENELISIIIPMYNAQATIEGCIASIKKQTYPHFEAIIIDDGSADDSIARYKAAAAGDERFILISKQNEGVSAARNDGLKRAAGKYITFVDADDTIKEDYLKYLYTLMNESGCDLAVCSYEFVDSEGNRLPESDELNPPGEVKEYTREEALRHIISRDGDFCGHSWEKLFKRGLLDGIRFDSDIHCFEDLLFCVRYILGCGRVILGPGVEYNYYVNTESVLRRKYSEKYLTSVKALERIRDELEAQGLDYEPLVRTRIQKEITAQGKKCIRSLDKGEQAHFAPLFLALINKYCRSDISLYDRLKCVLLKIYFSALRGRGNEGAK